MGDKVKNILEEANDVVTNDRASQYGSYPKLSKRAIALYRQMTERDTVLSGSDMAIAHFCGKWAREMHKHKRDNIVDACGYLNLYHQCKEEEFKNESITS